MKVKLIRGGAWYDIDRYARCACRYRGTPGVRHRLVGFRVVSPLFVKNKRKVGNEG